MNKYLDYLPIVFEVNSSNPLSLLYVGTGSEGESEGLLTIVEQIVIVRSGETIQ